MSTKEPDITETHAAKHSQKDRERRVSAFISPEAKAMAYELGRAWFPSLSRPLGAVLDMAIREAYRREFGGRRLLQDTQETHQQESERQPAKSMEELIREHDAAAREGYRALRQERQERQERRRTSLTRGSDGDHSPVQPDPGTGEEE
jgi:uncharacterized damage-inducible protein DinB